MDLYGIPIRTSPWLPPGTTLLVHPRVFGLASDVGRFIAREMARGLDAMILTGGATPRDAIASWNQAEWERVWYRHPEDAWWER